jgi:hypothetical protein
LASRSSRNLIWPLYGILVAVAFVVSTTARLVVAIAGVMVAGLLWSQVGGRAEGGRRRRSDA